MTYTSVVVCPKCGALLLAKIGQKTRKCPYCGSNVILHKAKKVASAKSAAEASAILRRLKAEAAAKQKKF